MALWDSKIPTQGNVHVYLNFTRTHHRFCKSPKIIDRNILKALNKTYDFSQFPPIPKLLLISKGDMPCCNLRYFHNDWILNEKQVNGSVKVLTTFFKLIEQEMASFWWNFHHWLHVPEDVEIITSSVATQWWRFRHNDDISVSVLVKWVHGKEANHRNRYRELRR